MAPLSTFQALSILGVSFLTQFVAAEPGVVQLQFEKRQTDSLSLASRRRLGKRAGTAEGTLYNDEILYLINATVGTPAQSMQLQIDTGSSDIWVPAKSSISCQEGDCVLGSYDYTKSSTFVDISGGFHIHYGDGTDILGDYFNDTFGVAGVTVKNQLMGLAVNATENTGPGTPVYGLIGVGFDTNEAIFSESEGEQIYADVVDQMALQGLTKTRAFSLWLNDLDANTGSILFGGVDTAKYTGDLVVLPLQEDPMSGIRNSYTVTFAGLEVDGAGGKTVYSGNASVPILLDSGNSLAYVPDEIVLPINKGVGAVFTEQLGWIVPCSLAGYQGTFKFRFGNANGPIIAVDIAEFVEPYRNYTATPVLPSGLGWSNGVAACRWGLRPCSAFGNCALGDTFLRSAYVVFNQDGKSLAIAQAKLNATDSSIKQITDPSSIPGATSTAAGAPQTPSPSWGTTPLPNPIGTAPPTHTFDLGSPSNTASSSGSTSSAHQGVANAGFMTPSTSFVGAVVTAVSVLFGMVGGSMFIFA